MFERVGVDTFFEAAPNVRVDCTLRFGSDRQRQFDQASGLVVDRPCLCTGLTEVGVGVPHVGVLVGEITRLFREVVDGWLVCHTWRFDCLALVRCHHAPIATVLRAPPPESRMQAVQLTDHGGREVLTYGEVPDPDPAADEVLVDVKAGALNHLDVWTRRGIPGLDLEFPHVPGSDAAGVVVDVGSDVTRFEPGDHVTVWAGVSCGSCECCRRGEPTLCVDYHVLGEHVPGVHAERIAVPEDNLLLVPEGVDWATAAAAPLVFGTAWRMLIERGELEAGESVLVLGASGGVGHAAVQIAAHAGCEVFATAGTAEKRAHAAEIGADHTIDYTETNFADEIRARTGKRGVDVVVDHVGADTWNDSLRALARGGRVLTCGATTGGRPQTNLDRIFWDQLSVLGSTMAAPGTAERACQLVWDGTFEVRIRETLPMSRVARGHELLEGREGFGKVVVVPDGEYDG